MWLLLNGITLGMTEAIFRMIDCFTAKQSLPNCMNKPNDNIVSDRINRPLLYSIFHSRVQLQGVKALSFADRVITIRTDFEYF